MWSFQTAHRYPTVCTATLDLSVRHRLQTSLNSRKLEVPIMQPSTFSRLLSGLAGAAFLSLGLTACDAPASRTPTGKGLTMHLEVYKSPSCTCCVKWIDHLDPQEFSISGQDRIHMGSTKVRYNIAPEHQSCHTAISESGHYFEGHIPAKFIKQFLSDPPDDAVGLAVPGMPVGSPGMESGNRFTPYEVLQIHEDGSSTVFAAIEKPQDQSE